MEILIHWKKNEIKGFFVIAKLFFSNLIALDTLLIRCTANRLFYGLPLPACAALRTENAMNDVVL